ncbi:MAG: type II and III secretion system protein family protein [Sphingomonadaceae bacterium]
MMRGITLSGLLVLLSPQTVAAGTIVSDSNMSAPVAVEVGKGRLLRLGRPVASVFVADPAVADVEVRSPRLIYLYGKSAGETSFFAVDSADQTVDSFTVQVRYDESMLRAAFAQSLPGRYIGIAMANDTLILSGRMETASEAEDAMEIARRFVPGQDRARILNRLEVDAPTQVNLRVRIVEVSRDVVRQLGFNWDMVGRFGDVTIGLATGNPVTDRGAFLTRNNNTDSLLGALRGGKLSINGLIDALDERGLAHILAEPNLTALSGVPASFLAGGEYPIPVPQENNVITIDYKRFGVSLAFVATIVDGGRINLVVKPEVSQLTTSGALTMNGTMVPALTTRRVETTVDLASGQSFALAGLLQTDARQELRKFPGLGDIPVLGELFRSRRFARNETELVVIVTPFLVRPVHNADVHIPVAGKP